MHPSSALIPALLAITLPHAAADPPDRQLLWGDTHLHTNNSFDAFLNSNMTVDPDTAYRYARGEPVIHAYNRTRVQIETPLDFLVVAFLAKFATRPSSAIHDRS